MHAILLCLLELHVLLMLKFIQLPGRNTLLLNHKVGFFNQITTCIPIAILEHLRRFCCDTRFAYPIRITEAELERGGTQIL